ncbi:MAG: 4-(cytidine 5'-diphospho)-2-C-methyl-D-erythritol kinase [Thermodesulfovibrionales bacterium]|jgi:4-diphosphocytidyl-2-C-methyl-D-erythritol kinase
MDPLILKAPAKINWSLYVTGKRADGYHDIRSLMQTVSLYDSLEIRPSTSLDVVSEMVIPVEENLVYRAARLLSEHTGSRKGAQIILRKEIPSGAGLGGGSSDAATTLAGLNRLWETGLTRDELAQLGGRIGSDVPFFFYSPMAAAEGRGEIITPLEISRSYTLLIVKPEVSVPTAWAYTALDVKERNLTKTGDPRDNIRLIYHALKVGDVPLLPSLLHNDFEGVVAQRFPVTGEIREQLLASGALVARMSGSGSAIFGLFEDRAAASRASMDLSRHWNRIVETGR